MEGGGVSNEVAVVEDEPDLRDLLTEVLEERGHRVRSFASLAEADALVASPPDLLVTDVTLPDGSALALLERLRRVHPELPVLVVSGRAGEEDLLAGFAAGASDYITKPLSLSELQAKCTVLLTRAGRTRPDDAHLHSGDGLPGGWSAAFDRYRVTGVIGRGAGGTVYEATDERSPGSAPLALKVLPAELALDPVERQRFVREAYTLSLVRCPHVVAVHDFGSAEGRAYYAMDRVLGPTLEERVKREGPVTPAEGRALLRGVARALRAVHAASLVHRDVKPANVVLRGGRCEDPVLIDFGLAKQPADRSITSTGTLVGTPSYLSPEAILGRTLDARSDLFCLGQTVRFALTGQDPFPGSDLYTLLQALVARQVDFPPQVDGDLREVLRRVTAPDPDRRPGSAAEVLRLLAPTRPRTPGRP